MNVNNIIQVLPDSVANQIAAGEVVQRPASVIKELVENAIDAGATQIQVMVKEAGKYLIQVIDNGSGMSEIDARLAFERHATSKITSADDLFSLHTFGFRGEALPSIAAVAEVEIKTCTADAEPGTYLLIRGSTVEKQESVGCAKGTSIAVKNLFFNVPARRKFLKPDNTEYRNVETELRRVALCHPEVAIQFYNNDKQVWDLPASTLKQRIVKMFGTNTMLKKGLLDLHSTTDIVDIQGFICTPEAATKERDKQYLFVNGRYFQSAYFRSAIVRAYEQLLPSGNEPAYFIYLTVDTAHIDVNIHPSKTEIKFNNEQPIWQLLYSAVRATLGQYAVAPTINFEGAEVIDINIPVASKDTPVAMPQININPAYNPFTTQVNRDSQRYSHKDWREPLNLPIDESHPFFSKQNDIVVPSKINFDGNDESPQTQSASKVMQIGGKYILTAAASGFVLIDQVRAHRRVLYEQLLHNLNGNAEAQRELFPQSVALAESDYQLLLSLADDLRKMGLDISDFGNNTIVVQAIPVFVKNKSTAKIVEDLLAILHRDEKTLQQNQLHSIATALACATSVAAGKIISDEEMQSIVTRLFACEQPDICPQGKPTIKNIGVEEIDKWLGK
ncbi:DNA mismatch repair protein MutL [Bacteroidia bacterium]|nr:DNA mismatch repair protein MutL [Bacteroidia bacterium]